MVESFIQEILNEQESETLEFKESFSVDAVGSTICSFLNTRGGILVIGLRETGAIRGVHSLESLSAKIDETISQIRPRAVYSVSMDKVDGATLCFIETAEGSSKPYSFRDKVYVRSGATTKTAATDELVRLIQARSAEQERWERRPALGVRLSDLDTDELKQLADAVRERYGMSSAKRPEDALAFLSLMKEGQLLNSAALLLGRRPGALYPQAQIRIASFAEDLGSPLNENRVLDGNLFSVVEQTLKVLSLHVPVRGEFKSGHVQRTDTPAVPLRVIREAILNAVVHRDYSMYDANVSIRIFPDRFEIWNPGTLPKGLTVSELPKSHASRPRNPDIAEVFFLRGFIERLGIGTQFIASELAKAGLPKPAWTEDSGGVRLVVHFQPDEKAAGVERLSDRQLSFLQELRPGDRFVANEYKTLVGRISDRTARSDLSRLVQSGFLEKTGRGSETTYVRTERPLK